MAGKLIVIEGLDGSGKATQTEKLYQTLKNSGEDVMKLSFPNYDSKSSALVKMYLDGTFGKNADDVNAYAASSFYAVDRVAGFLEFWKKDYEQGKIILADRYVTSNIIYQMSKVAESERDAFIEWTEDYEYNKLSLPKPSVVIYLDVAPEISQRLMTSRYKGDETKKDIHEKNVKFLLSCRECAMFAAKKSGWNVISCTENGEMRTVDDIAKDIIKIVKECI